MNRKTWVPAVLLGICAAAASCTRSASAPTDPAVLSVEKNERPPEPPRLVLWITVDQMRGDYLDRYQRHFSKDGFNKLQRSAVAYTHAHFGHAITETAPGHATLFTGVSPKDHGIIANSWLLPSGREIQSVEDETALIVGPGVGTAGADPLKGRSPRRLLVETIGDVLIRESNQASKVIGISSKDRGAILPAGHQGRAYWLGEEGFVSSSYYGDDVPAWIDSHHEAHPPSSYLASGWELAKPEGAYDHSPAVSPFASARWGTAFPHQREPGLSDVKALVQSPFGDAAVVDLGIAAIEFEALGTDPVVDLLSLSLSSTDLIGHHFGPESREMEDQMIRLDREIARLLTYVESKIGLSRVLVVLSADHGGCESAEHLTAHGESGQRLLESDLERAARAALRAEFGNERLLLGVSSPYVFLRRSLIDQQGLNIVRVRSAVAAALRKVEGVQAAVLQDEPTPDPQGELIRQAMHPDRSGDIYVVPQRYTLFLQDEALAATHGSPWDYDTHVPLLIARGGGDRSVVSTRVDVRSVTATVAALVGVEPPTGSYEALPGRR